MVGSNAPEHDRKRGWRLWAVALRLGLGALVNRLVSCLHMDELSTSSCSAPGAFVPRARFFGESKCLGSKRRGSVATGIKVPVLLATGKIEKF